MILLIMTGYARYLKSMILDIFSTLAVTIQWIL